MARYRTGLPQLSGDQLFLTDGGLETSLIYDSRLDLPHFAAFDLMKDDEGRDTLRNYYRRYATIAVAHRLGFVLEAPTWRANPDWGEKLGYSPSRLDRANRESIDLMREVRDALEVRHSPMVISGCIGPRGDGYRPDRLMSAAEAERYHAPQIEVFRAAGADLVTAITMNYVEEAIGIAQAAATRGVPVAISFTVETDGRLATGQALKDVINAVDQATGNAPAYYMINCAHPTHFEPALGEGEAWVSRIGGIRANASRRSHAELDAATELDEGDPADLGERYATLRRRYSQLNVVGGCCGTDHRHVAAICLACTAAT